MEKVVLVSEKEEIPLKTISLEELFVKKIIQVGSYLWDNRNRYIYLSELQNHIDTPLTDKDYKEIIEFFKNYGGEIFESAKFTSYDDGKFYLLKDVYGKKYPDYPPELDMAITRRIFEK